MQDYAKLYKQKYRKPDPEEIIRRIRVVLRSDFCEAMMLVAIAFLVEKNR